MMRRSLSVVVRPHGKSSALSFSSLLPSSSFHPPFFFTGSVRAFSTAHSIQSKPKPQVTGRSSRSTSAAPVVRLNRKRKTERYFKGSAAEKLELLQALQPASSKPSQAIMALREQIVLEDEIEQGRKSFSVRLPVASAKLRPVRQPNSLLAPSVDSIPAERGLAHERVSIRDIEERLARLRSNNREVARSRRRLGGQKYVVNTNPASNLAEYGRMMVQCNQAFEKHPRKPDQIRRNQIALTTMERVFEEYSMATVPTTVMYTMLLQKYAEIGNLIAAQSLFQQMVGSKYCKPDIFTYNAVMKAHANAKDPLGAEEVLQKLIAKHDPELIVANKQKKRRHWKPQEPCPDAASFTIVLDALGKAGKTVEALAIFRTMQRFNISPTVVTYNALINARAMTGQMKEVMEAFDEMKAFGLRPNQFVIDSLIRAAYRTATSDSVTTIFSSMVEARWPKTVRTSTQSCNSSRTRAMCASLLRVCGRAQDYGQAMRLFTRMWETGVGLNGGVRGNGGEGGKGVYFGKMDSDLLIYQAMLDVLAHHYQHATITDVTLLANPLDPWLLRLSPASVAAFFQRMKQVDLVLEEMNASSSSSSSSASSASSAAAARLSSLLSSTSLSSSSACLEAGCSIIHLGIREGHFKKPLAKGLIDLRPFRRGSKGVGIALRYYFSHYLHEYATAGVGHEHSTALPKNGLLIIVGTDDASSSSSSSSSSAAAAASSSTPSSSSSAAASSDLAAFRVREGKLPASSSSSSSAVRSASTEKQYVEAEEDVEEGMEKEENEDEQSLLAKRLALKFAQSVPAPLYDNPALKTGPEAGYLNRRERREAQREEREGGRGGGVGGVGQKQMSDGAVDPFFVQKGVYADPNIADGSGERKGGRERGRDGVLEEEEEEEEENSGVRKLSEAELDEEWEALQGAKKKREKREAERAAQAKKERAMNPYGLGDRSNDIYGEQGADADAADWREEEEMERRERNDNNKYGFHGEEEAEEIDDDGEGEEAWEAAAAYDEESPPSRYASSSAAFSSSSTTSSASTALRAHKNNDSSSSSSSLSAVGPSTGKKGAQVVASTLIHDSFPAPAEAYRDPVGVMGHFEEDDLFDLQDIHSPLLIQDVRYQLQRKSTKENGEAEGGTDELAEMTFVALDNARVPYIVSPSVPGVIRIQAASLRFWAEKQLNPGSSSLSPAARPPPPSYSSSSSSATKKQYGVTSYDDRGKRIVLAKPPSFSENFKGNSYANERKGKAKVRKE